MSISTDSTSRETGQYSSRQVGSLPITESADNNPQSGNSQNPQTISETGNGLQHPKPTVPSPILQQPPAGPAVRLEQLPQANQITFEQAIERYTNSLPAAITTGIKALILDNLESLKESILAITPEIRELILDNFETLNESIVAITLDIRALILDKFETLNESIGNIITANNGVDNVLYHHHDSLKTKELCRIKKLVEFVMYLDFAYLIVLILMFSLLKALYFDKMSEVTAAKANSFKEGRFWVDFFIVLVQLVTALGITPVSGKCIWEASKFNENDFVEGSAPIYWALITPVGIPMVVVIWLFSLFLWFLAKPN